MASRADTPKHIIEAIKALPDEARNALGHQLRQSLTRIVLNVDSIVVAGLSDEVGVVLQDIRQEVMDLSNELVIYRL